LEVGLSPLLRCVPLAALAIVLLIAPSRAAQTEPSPRLDHSAVPTSESVDLTCDPEKSDYSGTALVVLDVKQAVDALRFHARALTIDSAELVGPKGTLKPTAIETLEPDQVRLHFAVPAAAGTY